MHTTLRLLLSGAVLTGCIVGPATAMASTTPESPPPPCAFGTPTVVAGTALRISGPISPSGASVEVAVASVDKRIHDQAVTVQSGTWQGALLFGNDEAGPWSVDVRIGDVDSCRSAISVVLPGGVVAPSPEAGAPGPVDIEPAFGSGGPDLVGIAAAAAAALVVAAWIFLALAGMLSLLGTRPFARGWMRTIALPASFLAVWGGLLAVALVVDVIVSLSHFDTGTPPDQQAVIDAGILAAAVGGAILGALAAALVHVRTRPKAMPTGRAA